MITTLPVVPANIKSVQVGDEILFRFFKEWQGSLIHCAIHHQTIRKLDLAPSNNAFLWTEDKKEKTDFLFARIKTNDDQDGYKIAREFSDRLEVREETEAYNKAFLSAHGVTDLDSVVFKINAIRPQ